MGEAQAEARAEPPPGGPSEAGTEDGTGVGPQTTGDAAVDAAVAPLARLGAGAPLDEHVRVLGEVHEALRLRLSSTPA